MHLSNVDLNLFVVFDTIYAEGGITRASRRLNLSQPAVSHALGRLREMFDDPLFTRHGHAMTPTPLARRMIEPIRQSLQGLEVTLSKVDRFDPGSATKRFVVGMRDALESAVLADLMAQYRQGCAARRHQRRPDRAPRHRARAFRRHARRRARCHAAAAGGDPAPAPRRRMADDRGAPAPSRSVRGRPTLDAYLAQEHIAVSSRRRGLSAEDFELGRHNLRRRVRLRCQNYFAACRVVSETDLILTMPQRYARILNAHFGNQLLPFPLKVPAFDSYLYWHANAEADPANAWLRQQIAHTLQGAARSTRRQA